MLSLAQLRRGIWHFVSKCILVDVAVCVDGTHIRLGRRPAYSELRDGLLSKHFINRKWYYREGHLLAYLCWVDNDLIWSITLPCYYANTA